MKLNIHNNQIKNELFKIGFKLICVCNRYTDPLMVGMSVNVELRQSG